MKKATRFNPKLFAIAITVCLAIAGIGAWVTGLSFWILALILVGAVLANGLIATLEDRKSSDQTE